ncbi:hypothetical protein [Streptomyces flavofungini]|uniref:hypothetical protein n=1 Tax=Streptomyces flavofungini TaxID=68200 RepID=UPI0025AEF5FC|nr:hypothetical protein [Streptomyces flavofungini]WJV49188.1 hypothetical protein QUY26_28985 [Streptomyces flavofungini]
MKIKQNEAQKEDAHMSRSADSHTATPAVELRCGGLYLTVQRVPVWLVSLITTAAGAGAAWWTSR